MLKVRILKKVSRTMPSAEVALMHSPISHLKSENVHSIFYLLSYLVRSTHFSYGMQPLDLGIVLDRNLTTKATSCPTMYFQFSTPRIAASA